MEYQVFKEVVEQAKEKKPKLFALDHDRAAEERDISSFEAEHSIVLSESHKAILKEHGGGFFGFANLYSLDESSDFYILDHLKYAPAGYIPISDNGCGDLYVQKIEENVCMEQLLLYEHDSREAVATKYNDIFEYLVEKGLRMQAE